MTCTLKQLSPCDGRAIYDMLQRIPADENGLTMRTEDAASLKMALKNGGVIERSTIMSFWTRAGKHQPSNAKKAGGKLRRLRI